MKLKKEYIFIIINYAILIICWAIFDSRIILMDNNILEIIGLINVLIHTLLMFGGEGLIYCIFATKNNFRLSIKVLVISMCLDLFIIVIYKMNDIIIYLLINQIIGICVGRIYYKIKHR